MAKKAKKRVRKRKGCKYCGKVDNPCEGCGETKESHILRYCEKCMGWLDRDAKRQAHGT